MKTVCLCMIVKNERHNLPTVLNSVVGHINGWCIFDTGSTDGTQDYIKSFFLNAKIEGQLTESKWVNFAHNRNEYLKSDYVKQFDFILTLDGDEELLVHNPNWRENISMPFNLVEIREKTGHSYWCPYLVSTNIKTTYESVTHEYLVINEPNITPMKCKEIAVIHHAKTELRGKSIRDINMIQRELDTNPNIRPFLLFRYREYLAKSHQNLGNQSAAIENYKLALGVAKDISNSDTVTHKLPKENIWVIIYQLGVNLVSSGDSTGIQMLWDAYNYYPSRAEPLGFLMWYYKEIGHIQEAIRCGSIAITIPCPLNDVLEVDQRIYDNVIPSQFAELQKFLS
jgi:glycosyltransferase involved in cell wall biosynthesis